MVISHKPECQGALDKNAAAIKDWKERWPNHCTSCNGAGGFGSSYDPSPTGVCLGSGCLWDFEPCSECSEKGLCSRCGQLIGDSDGETPCPHCNWDPAHPDSCPPPQECLCWIGDEGYLWEADDKVSF